MSLSVDTVFGLIKTRIETVDDVQSVIIGNTKDNLYNSDNLPVVLVASTFSGVEDYYKTNNQFSQKMTIGIRIINDKPNTFTQTDTLSPPNDILIKVLNAIETDENGVLDRQLANNLRGLLFSYDYYEMGEDFVHYDINMMCETRGVIAGQRNILQ
ncbi:MAG: hypothetical protein K0U41_04850 [Gammaproteobacteria bacterium]|nr:hypothetical protein [Gammaproteobacteria bacterium]